MTGYHLWTERYDVDMSDVFEAQDKIALAVVEALEIALLGDEKAAMLHRYTDNSEAYNLYLKGRYFWFKTSPLEFRKSREFFEQALDADPSYVLGHTGLAYFYGFASSWGMADPAIGWPRMEASIGKAVELGGELAEVHNALAALKWIYYGDWDAGRRELETAMELNPSFPEAHNVYGFYLVAAGQLDKAIAECKIAVGLDPLSVRFNRFLGLWLYYSREYESAVRQYRQTLELEPGNPILLEGLADACERAGHIDEAIGAWRTLLQIGGQPDAIGALDKAFASRDLANAHRVVANAQLRGHDARRQRGEYVPAASDARCLTRLGETDRAFASLEVAFVERKIFRYMVGGDPFYDTLRPDPRFDALVQSVGG